MTNKERFNASQRSKQIVRLRSLHGEIGDEWRQGYYSVIHAVESAISEMEQADAEIENERREV